MPEAASGCGRSVTATDGAGLATVGATAFSGSTTPQPTKRSGPWPVRCAVCSILARTWSGFQSGCSPTSRAATPATYGAEKLVPLSRHWPLLGTVESMSTPGAAMSTKSPYWEKSARSLLRLEAPTASTVGKAAG